jgi:hypothetical protein
MRTPTRTRRTRRSGSIRTSRARTRPQNRRRSHQNPRPLNLLALLALGLIGLLAAGTFLYSKLATTQSPRPSCVEVIGADRSESQGPETVTGRWHDELTKVIERAASCEGLIIAEGVYHKPGMSEVRHISFRVEAPNWLLKEQQLRDRTKDANTEIQEILRQPPSGGTDLIGWFRSVENHLEDIPGEPDVNVTLFTDGINSMHPVRMGKADLSHAGVAALIDRMRPDLPDCTGWRIAMLGVNTTKKGGVPSPQAEGAERFWRAFISACGGKLIRYDAAAQIHR